MTTDYTDGTDIGNIVLHIRVIREIRGSASFGIYQSRFARIWKLGFGILRGEFRAKGR
jgi:hypothetical protein